MNSGVSHPTVMAVRARNRPLPEPSRVELGWIRDICLQEGADDMGGASWE